MITGLGIDLVEVARIEKALKNPRFLVRILTPAERELARAAPRMAEWVAGRWAAKEAIAKAVSLGLGWQDVEVLTGKRGEPTPQIVTTGFEGTLSTSITHTGTHAAAVAVAESRS